MSDLCCLLLLNIGIEFKTIFSLNYKIISSFKSHNILNDFHSFKIKDILDHWIIEMIEKP